MSFAWGELDHIILFCDAGAPESDALRERGLHEGPPNTHPGQGTANRRFFFPNLYLELVWVENPIEAQSDAVRPTRIWERWSQRRDGVCPFGLVLRPGGRREVAAVPSWTYAPRYFPPGFSIEVAENVPANEPLLFYLPFARPALVEDIRSTSAHHAQVGSIIGATLHLPATAALSPGLQALVSAGVVAVEPSREYLLDLFHIGGTTDVVDMRPELPLRFRPARRASDAKH